MPADQAKEQEIIEVVLSVGARGTVRVRMTPDQAHDLDVRLKAGEEPDLDDLPINLDDALHQIDFRVDDMTIAGTERKPG